MAQDVNETCVKYAVGVVRVLFYAHRKMPVAVKARRLLQNGAQHVEVMREQSPLAVCLVEFCKCCDVVEKWRVAFLFPQQVATSRLAAAEKMLRGLLGPEFIFQLIAHHVEEQRVMGGNDCLDLGFSAGEQLHQVAGNGDGIVLVERGNWVVDVNVFDPAVGTFPLQNLLNN